MSDGTRKKASEFPRMAVWKLASLIFFVLFVVVGLLYLAEFIPLKHPVARSIVQSLAALLLTSGIVSLIANLLVRQELARFWLDAIGVRESIDRGGLYDIGLDFYAYDFRSLITNSKHIDIYVIHMDKWLGNRLNDFRDFLSHKDHELRVCLLDEKSPCAPVLSQDFSYREGDLATKINNTCSALESCITDLKKAGQSTGRLRIWKQSRTPKHTYYRFDDSIILVPYTLSAARAVIPVFAFKKKIGGAAEFFLTEFDHVIQDHAQLVYDSTNDTDDIQR